MDLCKAISSLKKLKSLKLEFLATAVSDGSKSFDHLWLGDLFETIGKKTKLEKFSLGFWSWNFENSDSLFEVLCDSLRKLTQLAELGFDIRYAKKIGDQEIIMLSECFKKLTKLQDLKLRISNGCDFKPDTFANFVDCIADSFPYLSKWNLVFNRVKITQQSFKILEKAFKKIKCLNSLKLMFDGQVEDGLDIKLIFAGLRKHTPCDIYHNSVFLF